MDKNTVDECFRTTLSTHYFANLNFFSVVHFSDYFSKQKIATSFAYNLQVTPDKIQILCHGTPLNKADGLFGFVHS